jgi:hypothetical protein
MILPVGYIVRPLTQRMPGTPYGETRRTVKRRKIITTNGQRPVRSKTSGTNQMPSSTHAWCACVAKNGPSLWYGTVLQVLILQLILPNVLRSHHFFLTNFQGVSLSPSSTMTLAVKTCRPIRLEPPTDQKWKKGRPSHPCSKIIKHQADAQVDDEGTTNLVD